MSHTCKHGKNSAIVFSKYGNIVVLHKGQEISAETFMATDPVEFQMSDELAQLVTDEIEHQLILTGYCD